MLMVSGFLSFCDELVVGKKPEKITEHQYIYGFNSASFNTKYMKVPDTSSLSLLARNFDEIKNYPLTPGDVFSVRIVSGVDTNGRSSESSYSLQLKEDYSLTLPLIGKIDAKNKNIIELQKLISERIKRVTPVQFVDFSLSHPAVFDVFYLWRRKYSWLNSGHTINKPNRCLGCRGRFYRKYFLQRYRNT